MSGFGPAVPVGVWGVGKCTLRVKNPRRAPAGAFLRSVRDSWGDLPGPHKAGREPLFPPFDMVSIYPTILTLGELRARTQWHDTPMSGSSINGALDLPGLGVPTVYIYYTIS